MRAFGLRRRLNLVLLPSMAVALAALVWIDYRHEITVLMSAHIMHEAPVGASVMPNPVPIHTDPTAVARWTLWVHVLWAGAVLVLMAGLVNLVLQRLVVRPLADLEQGMVRMIRGDWHPHAAPSGADEIDRVRTAFRDMGPILEAVVGQALQAERLATLAAVSKHLETRTSGSIRALAETAAGLTGSRDRAISEAGIEVSRSAASIVAVLAALDTVFRRPCTSEHRTERGPGAEFSGGHRAPR